MTGIPWSCLLYIQKEKDVAVLREKEMAFRADMADAARQVCRMAEARSQDLEAKLQQCMVDRDELQRRLEEANSAAGVHTALIPPMVFHTQSLTGAGMTAVRCRGPRMCWI